jgi:hypothetical protein
MKIIGKDFDAACLLAKVRERFDGATSVPENGISNAEAPEPSPDPEQFYVEALQRHSDPREGTPLETHRTGPGRAVLAAKWAFRKGGRPFINELLERQRIFNGYARDAIGLLFAEVRALREEVAELRQASPENKEPKR